MALAQATTGLLQSMVDDKGRTLRVEIRQRDGYINATLMCQSAGKVLGNYRQTKDAKAFLAELAATDGITSVDLVRQETGGNGQRHTWVSTEIGVDLARWISPKFGVFMTKLVLRYAKGELTTEESRAAAQEVAAAAIAQEEPARATGPPAALLQWWSKREEGREANKGTGADLMALTGRAVNVSHFSKLNEGINHAATGRTTKQLRTEAKIKKGTPRNRMQTPNLCLVAYQELMIQEKWRREVESRQAQGLSPEEAMRLAKEVSREVLTCCKSTRGDQMPLLAFQPPTISQVQKALGSKKLTQAKLKILERAALPVLKALPAPPPQPAPAAPALPFDKDDLYD